MKDNLIKITSFNNKINSYLPFHLEHNYIYRSAGLDKHILKRHPDCLEYLQYLDYIISHPDYIGINPNENGTSFELVKVFDENIQIGIKLDVKNDYLYVATLHSITDGKLQHGIKNGRLKKFDKNE
ncbi:MAG: hypothetical protein PHQ72_12100 [Hespellia sp.]|nr:hypothetical protein [Hespellia sp.]